MSDDMNELRQRTESVLYEYLRLYSAQQWDEWIDLWADDGVLEFPFAPAGRLSRYVGKVQILKYMKPLGGRIVSDKLEYFNVFPMADPATVYFEMAFTGHIATTGAHYNQKYASLVQTRDGKIVLYREYWNPLNSIDAAGSREAWTAGFGLSDKGDSL